MSRLPQALLDTLLSPSATIYRGVVKSVGGGMATVTISGVDIPRISYPRDDVPAAGDTVFLLGQDNFGLTIFSIPATATAAGAQPAPTVTLVEPSSVANHTATTWNTSPSVLQQRKDYASAAVWFYARNQLSAMNPDNLGSVEMRLTLLTGSYVELARHATAAPGGAFAPDDTPTKLLNLDANVETWVPLPLAWGRSLITGDRLGMTARSADYDADLDFDGTLRFTTL